MAIKVTYTDKSGKSASAIFPSRSIAEVYARSVRNPKLEDVATQVAPVTVRVCPVATLEAQSEASKAYHTQTLRGELYTPPTASEHAAEAMAEHFAEARAVGMTMADAWADWDEQE